MSRKVRVTNRINAYCERFPSAASRASVRSELRQAHGYLPLSEWTESTFQSRLRELQGRLKTQSVILKFQRLHRFFTWEIEQGNRRNNPIRLESLPRHRNMRAPNALTHNEVQRLYKMIPASSWIGLRDRLAMSLMLVHGYRISTIVGMNWTDFETRGDGFYVSTSAKNGVLQSRRVRADVQRIFDKFERKTLECRR
jgi:site-specific recombinase XerD